jgi:hypothetical protein
MTQNVSRFQERLALMMGAAALVRLVFGKRRPHWSGIVMFGMGGLLLLAGVNWLRSNRRTQPEDRPLRYEPLFDIVAEDSEESFPASDPPAFAMGVR